MKGAVIASYVIEELRSVWENNETYEGLLCALYVLPPEHQQMPISTVQRSVSGVAYMVA